MKFLHLQALLVDKMPGLIVQHLIAQVVNLLLEKFSFLTFICFPLSRDTKVKTTNKLLHVTITICNKNMAEMTKL